MSRVSTIERLKAVRKSALEFHYEKLTAPPVMAIFSPRDIDELIRIATSLRYNGNISKKYALIDEVMQRRGFYRAHAGTNRVVYHFTEDPSFVAKVAVDKMGMQNSPQEYINQMIYQPFCTKIFEPIPSGVINFAERVNPISSIDEFISCINDIFTLIIRVIVGKYVADDLGSDSYMNYGMRQSSMGHQFGPVVLDFPMVYELDDAKLICRTPIEDPISGMTYSCGGDIDYDIGFNKLVCAKCGRIYHAKDLAKPHTNILKFVDHDAETIKKYKPTMRSKLIDGTKVLSDVGFVSDRFLTREEFINMSRPLDMNNIGEEFDVDYTERPKRVPRNSRPAPTFFSPLQLQYLTQNAEPEADIDDADIQEVHSTIRSIDAIKPIQSPSVSNRIIGEGYQIEDVDEVITPDGTPIPINPVKVTVFNSIPVGGTVDVDAEVPSEEMDDLEKYGPEYTKPETVYSQEEVSEMASENAARNDDSGPVQVNTVLEPERDAEVPQESPFTRPYPSAPFPTNVSIPSKESNEKMNEYIDEQRQKITNPMGDFESIAAERAARKAAGKKKKLNNKQRRAAKRGF